MRDLSVHKDCGGAIDVNDKVVVEAGRPGEENMLCHMETLDE